MLGSIQEGLSSELQAWLVLSDVSFLQGLGSSVKWLQCLSMVERPVNWGSYFVFTLPRWHLMGHVVATFICSVSRFLLNLPCDPLSCARAALSSPELFLNYCIRWEWASWSLSCGVTPIPNPGYEQTWLLPVSKNSTSWNTFFSLHTFF